MSTDPLWKCRKRPFPILSASISLAGSADWSRESCSEPNCLCQAGSYGDRDVAICNEIKRTVITGLSWWWKRDALNLIKLCIRVMTDLMTFRCSNSMCFLPGLKLSTVENGLTISIISLPTITHHNVLSRTDSPVVIPLPGVPLPVRPCWSDSCHSLRPTIVEKNKEMCFLVSCAHSALPTLQFHACLGLVCECASVLVCGCSVRLCASRVCFFFACCCSPQPHIIFIFVWLCISQGTQMTFLQHRHITHMQHTQATAWDPFE